MKIPHFYIEPANFNADSEALTAVRNAVFVIEQGIPTEQEFDELDKLCWHFLARDTQSRPIGTVRLSQEGKIGRLAVVKEWRGKGVGESLLRAAVEKARNQGLIEVTASAQVSALGFYKRFWFAELGEAFMEAGIPHQTVKLALKPKNQMPRQMSHPRAPSVQAVSLDKLEETVEASLQLISGAGRQIHLFSRDLDPGLYGQSEVVEALKQFALHNRNSTVRIIIQEPASLRGQMHPLLELAQRLTSHFLIRTPVEEEDLQYASAFIINDREGYLFRLVSKRFEGHWSPSLPAQNRQLLEEFERIWQRSVPCAEFRALGI